MRVLVATNELQGTRSGDYAWTVEGELVIAELTECANPNCGCARGFSGLASSRATTTALVVELPHITLDTLRDAVLDYLDRAGWSDLLPADEVDDVAAEHLENVEMLGAAYAVGTVVERDGLEFRPRGLAAAA